MKQLDNYLITLAMTVQKLNAWTELAGQVAGLASRIPLRDDGWPAIPLTGAALAFHLGRFIFHAARMGGDTDVRP